MNINFRFGEHYYYSEENSFFLQVLVAFLGAFFAFGFSLFLYYRRTIKDREKEIQKKSHLEKDLLLYFNELIISILKSFKDQQKLVEDFIKEQDNNLTKLCGLNRIASNDFLRIKNIDNKDLFEAWVNCFNDESKIEDYKKIRSALDFLEGTIAEIERIYSFNNTECHAYLLEVKRIIDEIPDKLFIIARDVASDLGDKRWENEYYVFVDSQIKIYRDLVDNSANFEEYNSEFLYPLLTAYIDKYDNKPYARDIAILCKRARVRLGDVRANMKTTIEEFKKLPKRTIKSIKTLEKTIEKIKTCHNTA